MKLILREVDADIVRAIHLPALSDALRAEIHRFALDDGVEGTCTTTARAIARAVVLLPADSGGDEPRLERVMDFRPVVD